MSATSSGFVKLPNWLIDDSDLSLHELAVYIVLLRFRDNKTGECYPGMTKIADCARVSVDTVKRTIPKLEKRGMIRVTRRKSGDRNLSNLYQVAKPAESPKHIWEISQRGRRVSKRVPRGTEHPPNAEIADGGCSEHLGGGCEHPGVGAGGTSNKTYENKTHEQDLTSTYTVSRPEMFTFDASEEEKATDKQISHLKDLAIHLLYEAGGGVPNDLQLQRWRNLSKQEASDQIKRYQRELGPPDQRRYPQPGTAEYRALTAAGRDFAASAGMPDSVFEYGFKMKESTA